MRMLRCVTLALLTLSLTRSLPAGEPYEKFLAGLRERRLFDTALLYLDSLEADKHCPPEIKAVIPFEKASTLLTMARGESISNPDVQTRQLDQALGFLDQFVQANASHPRAGEANTERAKILLGKARVDVWQSRSPANETMKAAFQAGARGFVVKARAIFQTAHDQHKATWEKFPKFIDKTDDPEQYELRQGAETKYILAQLDLANCTYEESQTYDADSAEKKGKLAAAATEYEEIHKKYRSQLGGLYARTWQGKCYEEQGDIVRALGIYKELLGHPGQSDSMIRLQDQVRHFELICLNHPSRKDHQLVVDKANEWLADAKGPRKFAQVSLGIRWEQALAQEALAAPRETPADDQKRLLNQALATIRTVKRYPGEFKDLATFKERDLMVKLKGDAAGTEPENFDTAFSLAQELVTKKTKELQDQLTAAQKSGKKDQIQQVQQEYRTHLEQTTRLLRIALRTADSETPLNDLNRARYYLAYVNLLSRNNYEAAILSEFVAMRYGKENPVQAQDSAYMAMAGYVQAFNDAEKAARRAESELTVRLMKNVADYLVEKWPASDRAMDARVQMGTVSGQLKQHQDSAGWFVQIPDTSARFTESQTRAGQAYWAAYLEGAAVTENRPADDVLAGWMAGAEKHLRVGIDRMEKETPPATPAPETLTAAKASLVQVLVSQGKYQDGVNLLTKDPHAVIGAIQVPDEKTRPVAENTVKGVKFASFAYQLLLRCYVGTQQLNEARAAMASLEKIGGGGGEALTEVYRQLGLELEKELNRLKAANQTQQLDLVRKSFETFLEDVQKRPDQTVNSLTWIGETWYGMASSGSGDVARYFDSAAAGYQAIIDRAQQDSGFIDANRLDAVRLRLVNCRRSQGKFEEALSLVREVIKQKATYLDAQVEAALVYQAWGESGQGDVVKNLQTAIAGDKASGIWGWNQASIRLQRLIESGQADARLKYEDRLYEARFNVSHCQYLIGKAQTGKDRSRSLVSAEGSLYSFVAITRDFKPDWWPKFDKLYQDIQRENGVLTPKPLEAPKEIAAVPAQAVAAASENSSTGTKPATTKKAASKPAETAASSDSTTTLAIFGVIMLAGLGGGGWMVFSASRKKPRKRPAGTESLTLPTAEPAARRARPTASETPASPAAPAAGTAPAANAAEQKKRPMTPEEKERYLKAKAARDRAAQQAKKPPESE